MRLVARPAGVLAALILAAPAAVAAPASSAVSSPASSPARAAAVSGAGAVGAAAARPPRPPLSPIVFLLQGDRSFDNYFGTFPGADGIPAKACQPILVGAPTRGCVRPFPLHSAVGQRPGASRSVLAAQIDKGAMDGFVSAFTRQGRDGTVAMGYYDGRDLPFSWDAARQYVLFDRFFSATPYGIRLNRSYWVAASPPPGGGEAVPRAGYGDQPTIFDRLQAAGVSWKFYVQDYDPHETFRAISTTDPAVQTTRVPLLNYARFVDDPRLRAHVVDLDEYFRDLQQGTLPAVAYVASSSANERSPESMVAGQKLVRSMVTQLMLSRFWSSAAFLWSYDGAGGWYDHVAPPVIDGKPAGLRVPALLVSAYARAGQVNHTQLDYTSALRFVEQNWNLAPLTPRDSRADSLDSAFDFTAGPRPASIIAPAAEPPSPRAVNALTVYGVYGCAALLAVLLLGFAGWAPIARRRRAVVTEPSRNEVPIS